MNCESLDFRPKLDKILFAQKAAVSQIMLNDFFVKTDISKINVQEKYKCVKQMKKLNQLNWQYLIVDVSSE